MSNNSIDPLDEDFFLSEPENNSSLLPEVGAETPPDNTLEDLNAIREELRTGPLKEPAQRTGIFSRLRDRLGKTKELSQPVSDAELSPSPERYEQAASAPGIEDTPAPAAPPSTPVYTGYEQVQDFGFYQFDDQPDTPRLAEDGDANSYPASDSGSFLSPETAFENRPLVENTQAEPDFPAAFTAKEDLAENNLPPAAWKSFFSRFLTAAEDSQDATRYNLSDDQLQNRLGSASEEAENPLEGSDLHHKDEQPPPVYQPTPVEDPNPLPDWLKESETLSAQPTAADSTSAFNEIPDPLNDLRASLWPEDTQTTPAVEEDWLSDDDDPMAGRLSSLEEATGFDGLTARLSSAWNQPTDGKIGSRFPEPNPGPPAEVPGDLSNRPQLLEEDENSAAVPLQAPQPDFPVYSSPYEEAQVQPQSEPEADNPFSNLLGVNRLAVLPSTEDPTALHEMRSAALEGYEPFQAAAEEEAEGDSILHQTIKWITDPRHRMKVMLGVSILVGVMLLAATSIYLLQRSAFSRSAAQLPASNPPGGIPYPVGLRFPGGWYFQLSSASMKDGQWKPQSAEWLQGAEIRRVIGVPWNRQSEAVVRSFEPGDPIELQMSNGDVLLYSIQSVSQVSSADTTVLTSYQPSLVVILVQPSASSRWVVVSNLKE
jgi:hypothetical protein